MADLITVVNMIPNLSSGETNQDSEPNLAVNPANPQEMAATAFTPSPNAGSQNSPIYYSKDGGSSWSLLDIIGGTPVRDQTLRFADSSGLLYAGVLWGTGNIIANINFDILRTNDFSGINLMTKLASRKNDDQPFVQAATVQFGSGAGKDRIYVGSNDHAPSNIPATIDYSLDAAAAAPATTTLVVEGRAVARDYPQTRPSIHPSGTVYAVFYAIVGGTADVVIVRDDNWALGPSPFQALIDTGDLKQGVRIKTGLSLPPLNTLFLGQQRLDGDLSIAVDPNDSARVYVCYADQAGGSGGTYTLHVLKSVDSGATWSADLKTVANAVNPALAIDDKGKLGFLYQQSVGSGANQRWLTTLELTHNDFASITTHYLSDTPANTPVKGPDPYLGDYLYMMALGTTFYGIFSANNTPDAANFPNGVKYQRNANFATKTLLNTDNVTPVSASIDPFFFKVLTEFGTLVTAIASGGRFANVCLGSFADEILTLNNAGNGTLTITGITSSSGAFRTPDVIAYPMKIGPGDSTEVVIRFQPSSLGPVSGVITVFSDDPKGPHQIPVSGDAPAPRLSLVLADKGTFRATCVGSFSDEPLLLCNSGKCTLEVTSITSSSAEFQAPEVLSYPLTIGAGGCMPVPIRFAPTSFGPKSGTVTVLSNDPAGARTIGVSGNAPSGKLTVTGSTCFGGVRACCPLERVIAICNTGDCKLHVTSVQFKKKTKHWKLVNNPFPAVLHPGSCLSLVIRYKANERCPRCNELVIQSDDPGDPVKVLELLAYTIWERDRDCGCGGEKRHDDNCRCCPPDCCDDEDEDDKDSE
ncbi:MAG TPA: choice-of-anchor D domain-containing protein [Bryobacteraceae bacterium]|nr:choice-of-anchor D domain-containing protein [Bryobacteraceae bacterium]